MHLSEFQLYFCNVLFLNFTIAHSAIFQLLKSPITAALVATYTITENVTLHKDFVIINCFLIDITTLWINNLK